MNDKSKSGLSQITKDDLTKLKDIFEQIEADPKSYDFLEPVDHVGLGLEDYLAVIKNPMDIATIKVIIYVNKE